MSNLFKEIYPTTVHLSHHGVKSHGFEVYSDIRKTNGIEGADYLRLDEHDRILRNNQNAFEDILKRKDVEITQLKAQCAQLEGLVIKSKNEGVVKNFCWVPNNHRLFKE